MATRIDRMPLGGGSATDGHARCLRCGRRLTAPERPVCAAALGLGRGLSREEQGRRDYRDLPLAEDLFATGLVCRRLDDGTPCTNVPHLVTEHSPDGFEWGYGGSGPADLAMNLVEAFLRRVGYDGPTTRVYDGECFALSVALHQEAKWELVAPLDAQRGGAVNAEAIWDWLDRHAGVGVGVHWDREAAPDA